MPSFSEIYQSLPYLTEVADLEVVDEEWRAHAMNPSLNEGMQSSEYWRLAFEKRNSGGGRINANLAKVIGVLLSFPFSNAAFERLFSQLSLIKNKQRGSLKHESLLALLQAKTSFKDRGTSQAGKYEPTEETLSLIGKGFPMQQIQQLKSYLRTFLRIYEHLSVHAFQLPLTLFLILLF